MAADTVVLKNGTKMPTIGLGTFKSKSNVVKAAVEHALEVGYRHFDSAYVYENEEEIGEVVRSKIAEGKVKRVDVFITTKIWTTFYAGHVMDCLQKSLQKYKLSYVDLCLLHWPFAFKYVDDETVIPKNSEGMTLLDEKTDYVDVWRQMIQVQEEGLTKEIGVCNFNEFQLKRIIKETSVVPAVHQFEIHPYLDQQALINFCQSNNIVVTGYCPLGAPANPFGKPDYPVLLEDVKLKRIAEKLNKTVAQVLLRYQIQRGVVVIPKSTTPSRITSNLQVYDFILSKKEMADIKSLNRNWRVCGMSAAVLHKYFPFRENYSE